MQSTLIDQGLSLTLFGVGTVFTFLTMMVFATSLMSRLVTKYAPKTDDTALPESASANVASVDTKTLTIIKKAIAAHRQR